MHHGKPDEMGDGDVNAVAECRQALSVQPRPHSLHLGSPIIQPTNEGFRRRPVDRFPSLDGGSVVAPVNSNAFCSSVAPQASLLSRTLGLSPSRLRGVGSIRTASSNIGPPVRLSPLTSVPPFVLASGERNSGVQPLHNACGADGSNSTAIATDPDGE